MRKTKILTLCAMLSALGVTLLFLGSFIGVFDISFAVLASLLVVFCVIELNRAAAFAVYVVTSTLAMIVLPDKSAAIFYVAFFGYYPILKSVYEQVHHAISNIAKWTFFLLISLIAFIFSGVFFAFEDGSIFSKNKIFILLFGVIFLIIYDKVLTNFITFYLRVLRRRLNIRNFFKK